MIALLLLLTLLSQDLAQDIEKADDALNAKQYDTALEIYNKVLKQDPKQLGCLVGRSGAKLGKKDFDGAVEDASLAIKGGYVSEHAFVYRAMAKYGKKDFPGAIDDLRWGIVANPKNVYTYLLKAAYREESGDLVGAIDDVSDAIRIDGRNPDLWSERAELKRKNGDSRGAVVDFANAIRLEPDKPEHYYGRGMAHHDNSSDYLAIQDFKKVLELNPKHFLAMHYLGAACAAIKDRAGALEWYTKALQLGPDSAATLSDRAGVEIQLGKLDAALADVDRSIKANPAELAAFYRRSTILLAKGQWTEAKAEYERMLKLGPDDWSGRLVAKDMLAVLPELAADKSTEPIAKRLIEEARALIAKKSYAPAIVLLEEAIQIDVTAKVAFELLAQAHFERDDNKLGDHRASMNRILEAAEFGQGLSPTARKILFQRTSFVLGGLLWIARHQSADGRWSDHSFGEACGKDGSPRCEGKGRVEDDLRATSVALLAFLGAGYSQLSKDVYGEGSMGKTFADGLAWLLKQQKADGSFGDPKSERFLQDHAIATIALSEAYGMTAAEPYKEPATKAVAFLISARTAGKGWADPETTGWALLALWSAEMSELPGAAKELKDALEVARGSILTGKPLEGGSGELLVMAAAACARKPGKELAPRLDKLVPPNANPMQLYLGTLATRFGGSDDRWKSWKDRVKPILFGSCPKIGDNLCLAGAWDPVAKEGRLLTTAFNVLSLELYYNYVNAFGSMSDPKDEK